MLKGKFSSATYFICITLLYSTDDFVVKVNSHVNISKDGARSVQLDFAGKCYGIAGVFMFRGLPLGQVTIYAPMNAIIIFVCFQCP